MDKVYYCKKVNNDFEIDGNLGKIEWAQCNGVHLHENVHAEEPRLKTTVKALWSDNYVYFSFSAQDNFTMASFTNFNEKLYEEDVVEVFIDDNCDYKTYIEIEVNPLNAVLHYMVNNDMNGNIITFARTEERIKSAVHYDKDKMIWNTEIAVPMSEFYTARNMPPKNNDEWFVNFYRIDRGMDGFDEYSSWSPTGILRFHMPRYFGKLVFISQ